MTLMKTFFKWVSYFNWSITTHKEHAFPFLSKNSLMEAELINKQEIKHVKNFNIIIPILVCLLHQVSGWTRGPLVKYCEMFEEVSYVCL